MTPVERLTKEALETHDRETLVEALVAAARFGIASALPFDAAAELGLDVDSLVAEAAGHLTEDEEEFLRALAHGEEFD